MTDADNALIQVYRDYLACLNARQWDDLGRFVAHDVVHNGRRLGLSGYRSMLEDDVEATPELEFVPEILLADDHMVSCRLFFRCTRASFAEHVFYRFDDRRITEVWSLIDKDAVREQLSEK